MNTNVTPQQIQFYRDNGFVAVEGFLNKSEIEHWRRVTLESINKRFGISGWTLNENDIKPEDYYGRVFTQAMRLSDIHEEMADIFYRNRDLGRMIATLAGVDGIRVWHDQALIKPPYGNPTGWHLDDPYWSFDSRDSISIWVALDDSTLQNGCMYYLPGTHKTARFDNYPIGPKLDGLFTVYPEWFRIEPVAVPVPAGTAVFHNGLTAHGAGANMTNKPRRAMTCAYMPDGSTFNGTQNVLPDELIKKLKVGDLLNDDKQNPLVWSKN